MDDLIRRSDAIKEMAKAIGHIVYDAEPISCRIMDSIPAVEPKQGEWIAQNGGGFCCSECNHYALDKIDGRFILVAFKSNFCPNCGARMFAKDTNVPNKKE